MSDVKRGMTVYGSDGKAGRVDDVLSSGETGLPAYLVVDAGGFFSGDVVVPFDAVSGVDEAGVRVSLSRDEVKHAARYDASLHGAAAGYTSDAATHFEAD